MCSSMETRQPPLGTATAAEVATWLNLQQSASFSKIHPSSTSPVESSGDVVRTICPVSFKLQSLQEYDIAGIHCFPEKQVNDFHGLFNHNSLHFVNAGTNVGGCSVNVSMHLSPLHIIGITIE